MRAIPINFDSFDAALGPAAERFFGEGYKGVGHALAAIKAGVGTGAATETDSCLAGQAKLTYPADWSIKGENSELRPHLSTIDSVVIALAAAEVHLGLSRALSAYDRAAAWVESLDIKAGRSPDEDLCAIPVSLTLHASGPVSAASPPAAAGHLLEVAWRSTYICKIGAMTVRVSIRHAEGHKTAARALDIADAVSILGDCTNRVYATGFKNVNHESSRVDIDLVDHKLSYFANVHTCTARPMTGLESLYNPNLTLIDAIVGCAQLAQAALYAMDSLPREKSQTLWMRRIHIDAATPIRLLPVQQEICLTVPETKILERNQTTWRLANFELADFAGISGSFSVAHQIDKTAALRLLSA